MSYTNISFESVGELVDYVLGEERALQRRRYKDQYI